ncbi:IS110 family transposase [Methylobacterium sp. NEAU 140]|uniref:IS110 family transposase n=1 Tax=Methylobacterium sp. NEAU 140 TaxID=3064945 RepID=UPI002733FB1C|nr:IS110 family transposase [Methylobacterium sp. NEAU 140]MDP4022181.1 IS110 family transposase [Methylobacterium sp. NEAU 140]MDP4022539.1 IS110 family transposase [Methylobacterium sp. NEAU 140]MDP4022817.1 IS110 family transposase [Methylobacterium sp. NEAU 140]MDP4024692.1 IS110 family transposase [Methylobacterium sp. NEAU 140]MDP4025834.1 IS110 family transposase [Methylobacterium sp. NEAU 140]
MTRILCGVDIGADTLVARLGRDGPEHTCRNTPEGLADLVAFCRTHRVDVVAMEATGGYERLAFGLLWGEGLACALLNPRAVRRFAEGMGVLEKTDRIDAGLIAWYAQVKAVRPTPLASAAQARLTALVTRLRQLTALKVSQSNQARLVTDPDALASFAPILAAVAAQTRRLEALIAEALAADPLWAALEAEFRTIKGVAGRTVALLMAEMPEIGTLSGKAAAKLAGLAPLANDSGRRTGPRPIRAGRASVRGILFVVAEIVRRHEPDFQAFHQRLSQAGKPKKVIRVALAHKLLVRLNAKARDLRAALPQPA